MLDLILERTNATIPEEGVTESCVENRGSIASSSRATSTYRYSFGIRECECRIVTSSTTDSAVDGESLIKIEGLSQGDLFRRQRIVFRNSSSPQRLTDANRNLHPYRRCVPTT